MHVWIERKDHERDGIVDMESVEETVRALQLDGLMVCGVPVTIKRINDTVSPLAAIANAAGARPGMPGVPGMPGTGAQLALPAVLPSATSKIIRIEGILQYDAKNTQP